jgi:hypothetical protein
MLMAFEANHGVADMSLSEARSATTRPSQPLAWPIAGGKTRYGSPVDGEGDVQALHGIGTKIRVPRGETIFNKGTRPNMPTRS